MALLIKKFAYNLNKFRGENLILAWQDEKKREDRGPMNEIGKEMQDCKVQKEMIS